jgi:hypothetical protein
VTGSEAKMGAFGMLVSGLGLAGAWFAGAVTRPENRAQRMLQGALAMSAAILILAWEVNLSTLVLYGCVTGLLGSLFNVAYGAAQFKVVAESPRLMRRRADALILREVPIALGRVLGNGFLFLFVTGANTPALRLFMALIGGVPLAIYFIIRPILTRARQAQVLEG